MLIRLIASLIVVPVWADLAVVRGQRCDALGAASAVFNQVSGDRVRERLYSRPLGRQLASDVQVLGDLPPPLQVGARGGQM
jgi:hypothetical protein